MWQVKHSQANFSFPTYQSCGTAVKRERNYAGQRLWARGFFVDTVGRREEVIRRYIQEQEAEDRRLEQLELPTDEQN